MSSTLVRRSEVAGRGLQQPEPQAVLLDPEKVRADFPILAQQSRGKPLVYLDNAATTQKPLAVIDAIRDYYLLGNANVHRGVHELSERATRAFEGARNKVRRFIGAGDAREVIFVRGTTEAINLVANSFVAPRLAPGDEVLISAMEHHSNIVPWQIVCDRAQARLVVAPIDDAGQLVMDELDRLLTTRTRMVAVTQVSNALGTINPIEEIIRLAHAKQIPVLVDGAQAVPHMPVDVRKLDCDFYALSGHKMFGPTGIGVLFGKAKWLEGMPPYQGGGDMIKSVTFEKTIYNDLPYKFEAGTPDIAGVIGLGAAVDYLEKIGMDAIATYEADLLSYGTDVLTAVPGLRMVGTARQKASVLSFLLGDVHPHDLGTIVDTDGIAIRTGHHCAQPVMDRFCIPATARASLAFYNTRSDIDALARSLERVVEMFR